MPGRVFTLHSCNITTDDYRYKYKQSGCIPSANNRALAVTLGITAMSLRTKLLTHALPLIPTHSFTPLALTHALSALPTSHPDHQAESLSDTVLDTLFGSDVAAKKALVGAWEEEGLREMRSFEIDGAPGGAGPSTTQRGGGQVMLREMMGRRLEYSARVGEHLVEVSGVHSSYIQRLHSSQSG